MNTPDISAGQALGGIGGGAVVTQATVGLERAAQMAGDTLRGIFGGLPWEMSPGEIVDAVAGGLPEAAAQLGVILA